MPTPLEQIEAIQSHLTAASSELAALKAALVKPDPVIVTPPKIPVPPADALHTNNFTGDDLGQRINAANRQLGDREGAIVVDESGTIATQVTLFPKRALYLSSGPLITVNPEDGSRYWSAPIIHGDHFKLFGLGMDRSSIIEPPDFGFKVIASLGSETLVGGQTDVMVTSHVEMAHFSIVGSNTGEKLDAGTSRFATITEGNAHDVHLHDLGLIFTSCLGITAGGASLQGNRAERWVVANIFTKGVASQVLALINGKGIRFIDCRLTASGKLRVDGSPFAGLSAVDLEPNLGVNRPDGTKVFDKPKDVIQDVELINILVDSTESPFTHGNAFMVQNNVGTLDYGPVLINNCRAIGGPLSHSVVGNIATAFYVGGQVANVTLIGNHAEGVSQSLYRFEDADRITAESNTGKAKAVGGSETVEVDINNVTNSRFETFRLQIEPAHPSAKLRMHERGNSSGNEYRDNVPEVTRIA